MCQHMSSKSSQLAITYSGTANHLIPSITGTAFVNGKYTVLFNPDDPFRHGISAQNV